jgi:16S rRNA G966 N2-methylase RsmD
MRIVGGEKRGLKLNELDDGVVCRPTIDRVKEAVFDIIQFDIEGDALDLFAGTGQLGIEALSRGCDKTVFCS